MRAFAELPAPRGLPLLGNTLQLDSSRVHLIFERWARELGPVFRVGFGPRKVLVLSELESIQQLLSERPDNYRRVAPVEAILTELGVDGVFSAEGAAWRRQRKLVMPGFSMRQQRDLFPTVALTTERLRDHWRKAAREQSVVDARTDLMRYTVDVTSHVVFGRDLDTLRGAQPELQTHLSRIFHMMNVRVNSPLPYWRYFKLPRDRAADRSVKFVAKFIAELIAQARAELERDPSLAEQSKTLLMAMLAAQRAEDPAERLSDVTISGNLMTLLLAGEDTTSNTLTWMLHYMAHHPEVQQRMREEADAVLGDASVTARYEDVVKLKYAAAVTQETLRMRSAAPVLYLEAQKDLELADVALPQGTWIFALTRHVGMDDRNFGDAQRFAPERWLAAADSGNASIGNHNPRAALAFGGGPRTCPGRSLALFECAMVAAMVARNFEVVAVSGKDEVEERFDFTMCPHGLRVRFVARA